MGWTPSPVPLPGTDLVASIIFGVIVLFVISIVIIWPPKE